MAEQCEGRHIPPYVQAYTPFVKALDVLKPFQSHPFLLTLLLGQDYIKTHKAFGHLLELTESMGDYIALKEAILLQLSRASARFEVVVTAPRLRDVLRCNLSLLANEVMGHSLLVQVTYEIYVNVPAHFLLNSRFLGTTSQVMLWHC